MADNNKIPIECHNDSEWVYIQKYLFKNGYEWFISEKKLKETSCIYSYPVYIIIYDDKFITWSESNKVGINSIKAKHYIRQEKLKRIT